MFRTKVEIPAPGFNISYHHSVLLLGSCFAENIGQKLNHSYFEAVVNPFGVLYNPVSIAKSIELLLENKSFGPKDIFQHNGLWQSFSHSSLFSAIIPEQCLEKINERLLPVAQKMHQTDILMLTFGTAWVFENRENSQVVSNCHKLPANQFVRRRLSVDEIVKTYAELISRLQYQFPKLQVLFTVSPIRHWKDGAHENNLSKGILLQAIDALQSEFSNVHYFPAYEIQLDELRDYRFYASDMLHPSEPAVDYIWKRFSDTYFDATTIKIKAELDQLYSDISHRPLHPESEEFIKFSTQLSERKANLILKYPFLSKRV